MAEPTTRIESIDALRGLAMMVMVLDHARHAFTLLGSPDDVATASPALFLTRWVTHFCAPIFVFLAGTSAWLYGSRGRSKVEVARFLASRGLWLIVLELTVISIGWLHSWQLLIWQVIAAIGFAMMILSLLLFLPRTVMILVGAFLVAGQDVYNGLGANATGAGLDLWRILQGGMWRPSFGVIHAGALEVLVIYPVLPWVGVLTLGYSVGGFMAGDAVDRRRRFLLLGASLLLLFVVVRSLDGVGNVRSFYGQSATGPAWMAFLACEKYPPSLAFLLMTLGPGLLMLGLFERSAGRFMRCLQVFGRVPLFFYVLHIYLLHTGSRLWFWLAEGEPVLLLRGELSGLGPAGLANIDFAPLPESLRGMDLSGAYVLTLLCILVLYPLCRWYGGVKHRSRSVWLSYL